jgi:hypothetical protein
MRELARDLPFEKVGEIVDFEGPECDYEFRRKELQSGDERKEAIFWLLIQAGGSVACPWNKGSLFLIRPERIIAFDTWPGPGSEAANFGLCLYPTQIEREYKPEEDSRFEAPSEPGGWPRFSIDKWFRYCRRHGHGAALPEQCHRMRSIRTRLEGWRWSSFCKTQYASNPDCGGVANFVRCHISVITLLERMARLPGLKVTVDDEGRYGPHQHAEDCEEAQAAGRRPTYRRHRGVRTPAALAKEVDSWNELVAGFVGAFDDALDLIDPKAKAAIKRFPDFEHLEFRGRSQAQLGPFLEALKAMTELQKDDKAGP